MKKTENFADYWAIVALRARLKLAFALTFPDTTEIFHLDFSKDVTVENHEESI